MKRALLIAFTLASFVAHAGTKFVGGGLEVGPTAPVFLPFAGASQKVRVSQILYTQTELGFAANTRIIDVAWRKEGLGPVTGAGGCAEQVYFKNVTRQMGPFTVGSSQPLADALQNAQKVIDKPASMLPNTMGFVTLDQVENQFSFIYLGDGLEVTIITDCRAAASPVTDAPVTWRYDVVPERVRVVSGDTTDGLVLTAPAVLSSWRPHTRFRTLAEQPRIEIRVAGNLLPNGGTFGVAMNHLAAGQPAPFAFELVNDSIDPVTATIAANNFTNGSAMVMVTSATVMPGQALPTPVFFTPTTAGVLARFSITWTTSAGTHTNTFQGTPTATPTPQPSGAVEREDGTLQPLNMAMPVVVQVGNVPPGHTVEKRVVAQNFGQGNVPAQVEPVSGDVMVVTAPAMVGTQQDVPFLTRTRAPMTPGPFTSEVRLTVGPAIYVLRTQGTVVEPEIAVAVNGMDFPSGSMLNAQRTATEPMLRTYTISNSGTAPLHVDVLQRLSNRNVETLYALPKVLEPGQAVAVDVMYPLFDLADEPFFHRVESNDADERYFDWNLSSLIAGRPVLQITADVDDRDGSFDQFTVTRGQVIQTNGDSVTLTIRNGGDAELDITGLTETCNRCTNPQPFSPVKLAPGQTTVLTRATTDAVTPFEMSFTFESNDPDGPFSFSAKLDNSSCSVSPGPMVIALVSLWLARRRSRSATLKS